MVTERVIGISRKKQEELEREYDRKLADQEIPTKKPEEETESHSISEYEISIFKSWVFENVPEEFKKNTRIIEIFQKVSLEDAFQGMWNYEIIIPQGLTKEKLIEGVSRTVDKLESLSGINFKSRMTSRSKTIAEENKKIKEKIHFLREENKCPSKSKFGYSPHAFSVDVSFYLRRRISIQKLEEVIFIMDNYILF